MSDDEPFPLKYVIAICFGATIGIILIVFITICVVRSCRRIRSRQYRSAAHTSTLVDQQSGLQAHSKAEEGPTVQLTVPWQEAAAWCASSDSAPYRVLITPCPEHTPLSLANLAQG